MRRKREDDDDRFDGCGCDKPKFHRRIDFGVPRLAVAMGLRTRRRYGVENVDHEVVHKPLMCSLPKKNLLCAHYSLGQDVKDTMSLQRSPIVLGMPLRPFSIWEGIEKL